MFNQENQGGYCTKCGTPRASDDLFFAKCGNKFSNTPAYNKPKKVGVSIPTPPIPKPITPVSNPGWKRLCCFFMFVIIMLLCIVPYFSFASMPFVNDPTMRENLSVTEFFVKCYDELQRATRSDSTTAVPRVLSSVSSIILTVLYIVLTQIYFVNAIIGIATRSYARLCKFAFKALKLIVLIFMIFTIYGLDGRTQYYQPGYGEYTTMGPGTLIAFVISLALIVACVIISSVGHRHIFGCEVCKFAYTKRMFAFIGSFVLCVVTLSQKFQSLFYGAMTSLLYDSELPVFIITIPTLIIYTALVMNYVDDFAKSGFNLTLYTAEHYEDSMAKKYPLDTPNLLGNIIMLMLLILTNIIAQASEYDMYIELGTFVSLLVIGLIIYIPYKIFGSKEKRANVIITPSNQDYSNFI